MIVTLSVFVVLQLRRRTSVDVLFLSAMLALVVLGVLSPQDALAGFSDNAPITIAGLLIVAAGLRDTGVIDWIGRKLLGKAKTEAAALRRLALSLVPTSAFLLNTALVVMAMPFVADWCRRRDVSPSKLMIPISYLAMLGGVCTLVGTSTTLIVNSTLEDLGDTDAIIAPLQLFEITWVGVPVAIVGTIFLLLFSAKLLPDRTDLLERFGDEPREYLVEMFVQAECSLNGQSVEQAGLRQLPGLFLVEIARDQDTTITPVAPTDVILAGDRLIFSGVLHTIVDLEKIPGLVPIEEMHAPQSMRRMAEAVLSRSSPLIGLAVRDSNFRERYNAAIIAVHRNGERLTTKVGEIVLEPGDTLLLQTRDNFVQRFRNSSAFYLVSGVEGYSPRRANKAWIAGGLSLVLVVWLILGNTSLLPTSLQKTSIAAISIAMCMIVTRCVSVIDARSAINLQVLLTIVGALALGTALDKSGAAQFIATAIVSKIDSSFWLLVAVYLLGMLMTEMVTNNAVAAILIPIAVKIANSSGHAAGPGPFIMAVALSASLAFLTPIGYQTNLMVMGPGGYVSRDYLKIGFPLAIVVAITAITSISVTYGIYP